MGATTLQTVPFGSWASPVTATVPCKVCDATARLAGVVDFSKNCEEPNGLRLPLAGIPIYYHRCPSCGLLFTIAFDAFGHAEFEKWVYNANYRTVDPDYLDARPQGNAAFLISALAAYRSLRILDYGGGSGKLAALMREAGFTDVHSYDPFVSDASRRPEGVFDFISCFEVLEHTPSPRQTLADIVSLLRDPGMLLFSTLVPNDQEVQAGMNWWYLAPRNGHVTLYSPRSLHLLATQLGCNLASRNNGVHVVFRRVPEFAATWFRK